MFKKTNKNIQGDLFSGVPLILEGNSLKQYNDTSSWHNQFYKQIALRIDESVFKVLYSKKIGAPNSSISLLVSMMIIKEAFGWSDLQLFERCRFDLLTRSALGLYNLNDKIPTESTYYLFRKRVHQYNREYKEDLFQKTFETITQEQIKEFKVDGKSIRMDSKLFGSNIAWYSRYEIIQKTFVLFCKILTPKDLLIFSKNDRQEIEYLLKEEPLKTVYHSTKEDIQKRMMALGLIISKALLPFKNRNTEEYKLLQRVFNEQYKLEGKKQRNVLLRPKEEISADSVQSPHDPDSSFRHKGDQKIKGYSANVTETVSEGLNLITNVKVDKSNTSDTDFVIPGIIASQKITETTVEKVYADGAYQTPRNDSFCRDIDMVFTGIQGAISRYDLEMTDKGLMVTDTKTGKQTLAVLARKNKNSREDRWVISIDKKRIYFSPKSIRSAIKRKTMMQRPIEELNKRNNVEATIFNLCCKLRNGKSKYRGLGRNQTWAICRCLWVNLVRIIHLSEQTFRRNGQKAKKSALLFYLWIISILDGVYNRKRSQIAFYFVGTICCNQFLTDPF